MNTTDLTRNLGIDMKELGAKVEKIPQNQSNNAHKLNSNLLNSQVQNVFSFNERNDTYLYVEKCKSSFSEYGLDLNDPIYIRQNKNLEMFNKEVIDSNENNLSINKDMQSHLTHKIFSSDRIYKRTGAFKTLSTGGKTNHVKAKIFPMSNVFYRTNDIHSFNILLANP